MEREKNKASNGEKVWLRTGRLPPATFTEAAETLTESGFTGNPEKGSRREPNRHQRVGPQVELGGDPLEQADEP